MDGVSGLFISHSSKDDGFVGSLRESLSHHGSDGWIDSRELHGGDPLWSEIQRAIEAASAYAVVVSTDALQSKWVGKELRYALELRAKRGKEKFPVIPLSLNGTRLGMLEELFGEEPIYIPVSSDAGGVEAAMNAILVAMGNRMPSDVPATPQPKAEPLEELVLELTDLKFHEQNGVKRASARARLVYEPATPGQSEVHSTQAWRFVAPIGPIEAEDLAWYLEKYAVWPSGVPVIQDRARKVERNLVQWGQLLHDAAMPVAHAANVKEAWSNISEHAGRRFSVEVDAALEVGAPEDQAMAAKEVATLLLGLPWELLHDHEGYLFQGAKPTRVRRRLPFTAKRDVPVVAPPIRVLLVTARPEDEACGYIDHRASALPLIEAMEALPGLVKIHVLSPPTLPALSAELDRARTAREPYHVVHFDGHGVYDRRVGLGGLCFEHPDDARKLERRRHVTVLTSELGPLLRKHHIPLVFLEACQTAQAEKASESVASELLKVGVASVVAMSHSILVETARQFVAAFYQALAAGKRVGDAMLAGQRRLKDDTRRGRIFGAAELRLEDWFVPVLFQEKDDPQLFTRTPARQTVEDFQTGLAMRLGALPPVPETGFIGRSRELLALQRLLRHERWAVVRGQGGEGKTTLAAEFARWMVRSHQMRRAAFVSVEGLEKNITESVIDKLGGQLVKPGFATAVDCHGDLSRAEQEVVRVLREQPTLLVVDNMESILLPPLVAEATPDALSAEAGEEVKALLALCERLLKAGDTRIVFTSREALPAPFEAARHRRELHQLDKEDAVKLVERTLNSEDADGSNGASVDARQDEIEALVDAVHGHARTLALLAPSLRAHGVEATRESLVELMADMERQFPGSREQSVFASVELSLRRMSPASRDRARVLGVFEGVVDLDMLRDMTQWEVAEVGSLAVELIQSGLATPNRFNHLTLNPALCPYIRGRLDVAEREALTAKWVEAMGKFIKFLSRQWHQRADLAATLTLLELPNIHALLEHVRRAGNPAVTVDLTTSLYSLVEYLGKPRLLDWVGQVRDAAAAAMGDVWNHTRFDAARTRIEQQLASRQLREAFEGAQQLLQRARTTGVEVYSAADYDLAMAVTVLGRVLFAAGSSEQALQLFREGCERFDAVAKERSIEAAAGMVTVCLASQGDCLRDLGRLDAAAAAYEESIRLAESLENDRQVAAAKGQLGSVRLMQRRHPEALSAFEEAGKRFAELGEPGNVSVSWFQIGRVHQSASNPGAAEDAYRKSLEIDVRLGDIAGQAATLAQLGMLQDEALGRTEEAVAFLRQAIDLFVLIGDVASEGRNRSNLALLLRKLHRLDDARREVRRAIECDAQFGHQAEPWKSWAVLAEIEADAGNLAAAAEGTGNAFAAYLAYRREGGENHSSPGRIALAVTQTLRAGNTSEAASNLQRLATSASATGPWRPFLRALQSIVSGSRDRALADVPKMGFMMAAEIILLIEKLEKPQ